MSIADMDTFYAVRTPCCDAEVSLGYESFRHRGKPRKDDLGDELWHLRCPACDKPHTVMVEVRYKYQRAECSTRYETRGRLVGAPIWIDRP